MYDLTQFTLEDITKSGSALRNLGMGAASMEEVANKIVYYLYNHLIDQDTGVNSCLLIRFFRTYPYKELDKTLRKRACRQLGNASQLPEMKWMTMLATAGERPEWNSTQASINHQLIPLVDEDDFTKKLPMMSQLVKQFGLDVNTLLTPPELLVDLEQRTYNVFYVPEAVGSPYIPAQDEFVIPYKIKSVLGFGGLLPSGNLFVIILFSKVYIPRDTADMFKTLGLNSKIALLPFDSFKSIGEDSPSGVEIKSQVAALKQLLEVNDQTVLKQAEKLKQAADAQIEELKKLNQLKDDFLSTVSHELRTPVASMRMAIQMLEVSLSQRTCIEEVTSVSRYLQILKDECKREISLINDLLNLQGLETRSVSSQLQVIQLQHWIPHILKPFQLSAQNHQQSLQAEIAAELPPLLCDPVILERILSELLQNACKYTPSGERIMVVAQAKSGMIQLSVSNSGVEIPAEELPRIFDRFYRISGNDPWKQGGTGLGLALVKRLVEHVSGSIQVQSEENNTCFTVTFSQRHH